MLKECHPGNPLHLRYEFRWGKDHSTIKWEGYVRDQAQASSENASKSHEPMNQIHKHLYLLPLLSHFPCGLMEFFMPSWLKEETFGTQVYRWYCMIWNSPQLQHSILSVWETQEDNRERNAPKGQNFKQALSVHFTWKKRQQKRHRYTVIYGWWLWLGLMYRNWKWMIGKLVTEVLYWQYRLLRQPSTWSISSLACSNPFSKT